MAKFVKMTKNGVKRSETDPKMALPRTEPRWLGKEKGPTL